MEQCQICHRERWKWSTCPVVPEWFSPSVISYCPYQVEWILINLSMLEEGRWPPDHKDTGYSDYGGRKLRRGGAYFEVPVCVAADVTMRLDRCGPDGVLAKKCLADGWDTYTLAQILRKPEEVLQNKIQRVIKYCSGSRARTITYYEFTRRRGIARANNGSVKERV